jgi:hypothetical protein
MAKTQPNLIRRRKRYKDDPVYRNRVQRASRQHYRRKNGVELFDISYSKKFVPKLAEKHAIFINSVSFGVHPVLSPAKAAQGLQVEYYALWRWADRGFIPQPIFRRNEYPHSVYHQGEVLILVEELGAHLREFKHLRASHTEVRQRIERRFSEFRNSLAKGRK